MSVWNNGGPAFPFEYKSCGEEEVHPGMSLRDWLAATTPLDLEDIPRALMCELVGAEWPKEPKEQLFFCLRATAVIRYMQADAMLRERAKAEGQS